MLLAPCITLATGVCLNGKPYGLPGNRTSQTFILTLRAYAHPIFLSRVLGYLKVNTQAGFDYPLATRHQDPSLLVLEFSDHVRCQKGRFLVRQALMGLDFRSSSAVKQGILRCSRQLRGGCLTPQNGPLNIDWFRAGVAQR